MRTRLRMDVWLALTGTLAIAVAAGGCSGPCDKACARLVEQCRLRVDSYSAAPDGATYRGCRAVDPGTELDLAICLEQCQDWQAAAAECLAALSCGEDAGGDPASAASCLEGRGRENAERDPAGSQASNCRTDCDRQADACGTACTTSPGDAPTCGGCYDNCDKSRARCRGWCKLFGQ
ncbi:MAG: hypothetical protein JXR83_20875 [Deltaproteobacteria bacterium]|nr:hypothetical protein [Deltaproteobacteria bacterium]